MGNVYMLSKINGKVVDLTDVPQIMVHRASNYEKCAKMLETMDIEKVAEYFCTNCGSYVEKGE